MTEVLSNMDFEEERGFYQVKMGIDKEHFK